MALNCRDLNNKSLIIREFGSFSISFHQQRKMRQLKAVNHLQENLVQKLEELLRSLSLSMVVHG